jgi:hypothetical protein
MMRYSTWDNGHDTASTGRLFEFTEQDIAATFKDGDKILLDKLTKLPYIFMQEEVDDQLAYVGTITGARISGAEISIEYAYDLGIPPLLNSTIYANRFDFDMPREFEFRAPIGR